MCTVYMYYKNNKLRIVRLYKYTLLYTTLDTFET